MKASVKQFVCFVKQWLSFLFYTTKAYILKDFIFDDFKHSDEIDLTTDPFSEIRRLEISVEDAFWKLRAENEILRHRVAQLSDPFLIQNMKLRQALEDAKVRADDAGPPYSDTVSISWLMRMMQEQDDAE